MSVSGTAPGDFVKENPLNKMAEGGDYYPKYSPPATMKDLDDMESRIMEAIRNIGK